MLLAADEFVVHRSTAKAVCRPSLFGPKSGEVSSFWSDFEGVAMTVNQFDTTTIHPPLDDASATRTNHHWGWPQVDDKYFAVAVWRCTRDNTFFRVAGSWPRQLAPRVRPCSKSHHSDNCRRHLPPPWEGEDPYDRSCNDCEKEDR